MSAAATIAYVVAFAPTVWAALKGTNALLKELADLPENWKKLIAKLRGKPKLPLALHEAFALGPVHSWLDQKYGLGRWRYDPDAVKVTVAAGVFTLFTIREESTGTTHVLAVRDDVADELPAKYLPAAGADATASR
jgi:hypothetical protein